MLVAGEDSGDRHAAALFRELKTQLPTVHGVGMGGAAMREAGIEILQDAAGLAVIGVAEVIRHYAAIRRVLKRMQSLVCALRPDLLICVDYKEFNFHLAKHAKACGVKVLFYVGPQFWAWRPGRVKTYGSAVSHMAVIFPFEVPHYRAANVPVTYVGHPLAGMVQPNLTREAAARLYGLTGQGPLIALLPGSRINEIKRLLPVMLGAARQVAAGFPAACFLLARSPSIDEALVRGYLERTDVRVRVIEGINYEMLQCCDAVMTSSGTATLEIALLGVPMVVVYRLSGTSYWLGRLLVSIPYIGLPNILSGRSIVREFIQHAATAENISSEIEHILTDSRYARHMREDLTRLREILGSGGGAANLARLAAQLLQGGPIQGDSAT